MKGMCSLVLVLLAMSAMATAAADCSTWACRDVKIKASYGTSDGDTCVEAHGNMALLGCTLASNTYITLRRSSLNYEEMYAILLARQMSDRTVGIRIIDQSVGCNVSCIYAPS
ncbi:hypothetical protein [Peristeroidobacter soli]|uniref:hypothetical protein n=1 Tax=Peristeroidobacter soli TaxID=2497877 RepID=UPI00101CC76D|nr:hypothetical protein [Peristeroidobacter soli]